MNLKKCLLMLIAIACTFLPTMAVAETTECTVIESIPTVITQQGVYCLKSNLATSATTGSAIDIQTNNVTIDFNGFKLGNLGGGISTDMVGVNVPDKNNIIIKNGVIRGFDTGVSISGGTGHQILNNNFDGNFANGIAVWDYTEVRIDGNNIINTGGKPATGALGINLFRANYSYVTNNRISGIESSDASKVSWGMYVHESNGIVIRNNTFLKPAAVANTQGMNLDDSDGAIIDNNIVSNYDIGITFNTPTDLPVTCVLSDNNFGLATIGYGKSNSTTLIDAGGNYPALPAP